MRQVMVDRRSTSWAAPAGINRQYFTSFQFKRTAIFVRSLTIAPPALATRLESLWSTNLHNAALALKELVSETGLHRQSTHARCRSHRPVRKALARQDPAWASSPDASSLA